MRQRELGPAAGEEKTVLVGTKLKHCNSRERDWLHDLFFCHFCDHVLRVERGYNEAKWESEVSELHDDPTTPSKGYPVVLTLKELGAQLEGYGLSYFEENHGELCIKVFIGRSYTSDVQPTAEMTMSSFAALLRSGDTAYKFDAEDMDPEKKAFSAVERETKSAILKALCDSELGKCKNAPLKPAWQKQGEALFDWSIFMGSGGTRTPMHFDTDLFNFLFVVEGKKRVVLVPKNKKTDKMFPLKEFYSGSGWTGVDILDSSFELPEGSVTFDVCAGQGIFIPFRWYHAVDNVESSVSYVLRVVE